MDELAGPVTFITLHWFAVRGPITAIEAPQTFAAQHVLHRRCGNTHLVRNVIGSPTPLLAESDDLAATRPRQPVRRPPRTRRPILKPGRPLSEEPITPFPHRLRVDLEPLRRLFDRPTIVDLVATRESRNRVNLSLEGRTALITGASRNIGAATARSFAAAGADLVLVARGAEALDAVAREVRDAHGTRVETVVADVAQSDGVAHIVETARSVGDIDIVVNNALRHG